MLWSVYRPVSILIVGMVLAAACTKHRSASDASRERDPAPADGGTGADRADDAATGTAEHDGGGPITQDVDADVPVVDAAIGDDDDAGLPRWSSHCHGLAPAQCDADDACGWARGAIGAAITPGCYELCPTLVGVCTPRASCELVLANDTPCGRTVCLPYEALPTECLPTHPCEGDAEILCWRQHPEPCGDCDSCVDETYPPLCFEGPDGRKHLSGGLPNADLLLPTGWTSCPGPPAAGTCD